MKKVLLSLAAATAIAAAAPAAAQTYGYGYGGSYAYGNQYNQVIARINERQANIAQRINRAASRGHLNRAEARRLSVELQRIEVLERRYRAGGLTRAEVNDLNVRLDRLQVALRQERRDDDRRYGSGYGNRW